MRGSGFLFIIFLLSLFQSCSDPKDFEYLEFVDFNKEGMRKETEYAFSFSGLLKSETSESKYDISLIIRYNRNYQRKDLILDYEETFLLSDSISNGILEISLFNKSGDALSKKGFPIYEKDTLLFRDVILKENSSLTISSPLDHTSGIVSIGVALKEK